MKQIVRYRFMTIPNKITGDIRITVDDRSPEYHSSFDGGKSSNIQLYPIINIQLLKPTIVDDNGNKVRGPWNPNDSIGLTKFNLPIFINELKAVAEGMKIPDLYSYHGDRLDLNDKVAERVRRVFIVSGTTIEILPVVLDQDDSRIEGIRLKFNNEQSVVLLTLNELSSLIWNLDHIQVDYLTFQLYITYIKGGVKNPDGSVNRNPNPQTLVDIPPKEFVE